MDAISLGVLALAVSLDSLTVGLVYGLRGIRLSWTAMLIVSLATGLLLSLAMGAGQLMASFMRPETAAKLGALMLFSLGVWITYHTWRSHRSRDRFRPETATERSTIVTSRRVLKLRLGSIGIVVEILREPGAADLDASGSISPLEACILGVALALDSVAAGFGAAMAGYSPYGLPLAAGAGSLALMFLGSRGASWLPLRLDGPWAMVHGVVLLLLGLYRMVV